MPQDNRKAEIQKITEQMEAGIKDVFDSKRFREYLTVMSKFHNYSLNNTLLIAMQRPGASRIAGYNAWKNNFGRNVKKGEKGIRILAPAPYKVKRTVEKIDPATKEAIIGKDGNPVTEEKEIKIPAFKIVSVFDVSQTEGKELPNIVAPLLGDVENYKDFFTAIEKTSPAPITFEKIKGGAHGYYHLEDKRIAIDEGMSELQTLKTAIHEVAHAKLHSIDFENAAETEAGRPDRQTREVEAESVAYTVCQYFGLDTSDYSFNYVAAWSSGKELSELKGSLETIRSASSEIITGIEEQLQEIQRERTQSITAEPIVTILWSESERLNKGETIPLSRANAIFAELDKVQSDSEIPLYYKTKFQINYVINGIPDQYEGRQDLGDGDGSLVEHIEQYHTYYLNNEEWNNYLLRNKGKEALEADKEQRTILLNEFVPYLKLHCNLSEMERIAMEALQSGNKLTPTETAYHTAMQAYVSECRGIINQGEYNLPPVPQLRDFDMELQAYKEHIMAEIAQEAASAGMTVEEYAANDYEPYEAPEYGKTANTSVLEKREDRMPAQTRRESVIGKLSVNKALIGKSEKKNGAIERIGEERGSR